METLTSLTNGVNYLVRVSAHNAGGYGPVSIATATPRTAPGAPTNLVATLVGSIATLTWSSPVQNGGLNITGYMIEESTDAGATWNIIRDNTGTSGTTFSKQITSGSFQYRVSAITSDAISTQMSTSSNVATLVAIQVVSGISNLIGTAGNGQVVLTWNAALGATSYKVEQMSAGV